MQRSFRDRVGIQGQHHVVEAHTGCRGQGLHHFQRSTSLMNGVELQASPGLQGTSLFDQANVRINGQPGELAHLCEAGTPGTPR